MVMAETRAIEKRKTPNIAAKQNDFFKRPEVIIPADSEGEPQYQDSLLKIKKDVFWFSTDKEH